MLKGVNKRIVEISNTNSKYFYKALLFVKPEYCDLTDKKTEAEANKYLNGIIFNETLIKPGYLRKRKRKIKNNFLFILFVLGVGIISIALLYFIKR